MNKRIIADFSLFIVTIFWGSSYFFTKYLFDRENSEFTIILLRYALAFLVSLCIYMKRVFQTDFKTVKKAFLLAFIMFCMYGFLMFGVNRTTALNAAFVNSLSIVIIPITSVLLTKKFPHKNVFIGAIFAITGVGMITLKDNFSLGMGDMLCFFSALFEALHITLTGRLAKNSDAFVIGTLQMGFISIFSLVFAFLFEKPVLPDTMGEWLSIIYLVLFCSALPILVQSKAQQFTTPSHTGIVYSTEPIFTTIISVIFTGMMLPLRGIIGALIALCGVFNTIIGFNNIFKVKSLLDKLTIKKGSQL